MLYLELDFGLQIAERIHRVSDIVDNLKIAAKQRKQTLANRQYEYVHDVSLPRFRHL